MRFLFYHDVPEDLSYLLEGLGHHVTLLRNVLSREAPDDAVLQFACDRDCLLL